MLLGIFVAFAVGTTVCNRVASSRVEGPTEQKETAVRTALESLDPAAPMGFDPERSLVTRYGLESISGGNQGGTVIATGEARWAWEYRCVVGQRLPTGAVETRVVQRACSDVDPRTVFARNQ